MNRDERQKLLEAVEALVGEHCYAFHFAAEVDADEAQEDKGDNPTMMISHWDGGPTMVMGMLRRSTIQMDAMEATKAEQERRAREEGEQ